MNKKALFYLLKFIFTISLLGFFLYRTDLSLVASSLQNLSIYIIPIVLALYILAIAIVSYKWKLLLPEYSLLYLMKYNFIGAYYSIVLPGQITGEVVKSYLLGKKNSDPHKIIASVFVDKVTGLISLMVISITGVILSSQMLPRGVTYSMVTFLALIIIILMGIRLNPAYKLIMKIIHFFSEKIPITQPFFNHLILFIDEWNIYSRQIKILLMNILVGIVFHFIAVLINYLLAKEVGIGVPYFSWCWIYGLLSIILLLPITIAGIGLREGSLISVLGLFGISNENALALSFILSGFTLFIAISGLLIIISNRFIKPKLK